MVKSLVRKAIRDADAIRQSCVGNFGLECLTVRGSREEIACNLWYNIFPLHTTPRPLAICITVQQVRSPGPMSP